MALSLHPLLSVTGFPGGSNGKETACNAGDVGSIPGLGRSPREGNGSPLQYSYLENFHGQRRLAGYGLWGHKRVPTTEQLIFLSVANCNFKHIS